MCPTIYFSKGYLRHAPVAVVIASCDLANEFNVTIETTDVIGVTAVDRHALEQGDQSQLVAGAERAAVRCVDSSLCDGYLPSRLTVCPTKTSLVPQHALHFGRRPGPVKAICRD